MKKQHSIWVLLLLLASCQLSEEASVTLPAQNRFYVVEAVLKPGAPMELSFTESIRMNDIASLNFVWNADAFFVLNSDTIRLTNFLFNRHDGVMVNYTSNVLLPYWNTGNLTLYLRKGTDTLTATARLIKPIAVRSCKVNGLDIDVTVDNIYEGNDRFFRMEAVLYKLDSKPARYSQLYNLASSSSSELPLHLKVGDVQRDSLKVVVSHISREHYEYFYSCERAVDAYFDPFTVPTQVKSNIKGGMGIFTVADERAVLFKSRYP